MAEAKDTLKSVLSRTLGPALAIGLESRECRSAASTPPAQTPPATPPPSKKYTTLAKCCSLDIIDVYSSKNESPEFDRKHSVDIDVVPGLYKHSQSHTNGFFGSQENLQQFLKLPEKDKRTFHRRSARRSEFPVHYPKSTDALIHHIQSSDYDPNAYNDLGDAPIHAIVRHKRKKRAELLLTLLVHGANRVDVNKCTEVNHDCALHLAVMEGEDMLAKTLLTFGAYVNPVNAVGDTPLDVAIERRLCNMVAYLVSVGGNTAEHVNGAGPTMSHALQPFEKPPNLEEEEEEEQEEEDGELVSSSVSDETDSSTICGSSKEMVYSHGVWREVTLQDIQEGKTETSLYERLRECINWNLSYSGSFSANVDEAIALTQQQRELLRYRKTSRSNSTVTRLRPGSRVLCLDGGGIRGLIQIEVLRQLEEQTGRRVTEIFDWIVGTSTGGIIALALVYGKRSLCEIRQLYFKIRDRVFAHERLGFAFNTAALEKVLKDEFGTTIKMNDVTYPRVLITAVYKRTTLPELHFFNNCFDDEFSKQPVWKVARYTSAAPLYFSEMDDYVDGGVLANNPCEYGLTAINNYYRGDRGQLTHNVNTLQGRKKEEVSLVVSVGTGIFPAEELGNTDAHQFLFFGRHWFKSRAGPVKRVENLIKLLTQALVESESVAENCRSRLQQKGIPFHRFNPHLDEVLPAGETDSEKLINMIMQTRYQTMGVHMDELVKMLYDIQELMKTKRKSRDVHTHNGIVFK